MTQIRLDQIHSYSGLGMYLNYDTIAENLVVSGSVADGATATFTVNLPYTRGKTRADLYAKNMNTGTKQPVNGGFRINPYQYTSTETASISATYTANNIAVTLSVFNGTGAPITLVSQILEITAVLAEVPLTAS